MLHSLIVPLTLSIILKTAFQNLLSVDYIYSMKAYNKKLSLFPDSYNAEACKTI